MRRLLLLLLVSFFFSCGKEKNELPVKKSIEKPLITEVLNKVAFLMGENKEMNIKDAFFIAYKDICEYNKVDINTELFAKSFSESFNQNSLINIETKSLEKKRSYSYRFEEVNSGVSLENKKVIDEAIVTFLSNKNEITNKRYSHKDGGGEEKSDCGWWQKWGKCTAGIISGSLTGAGTGCLGGAQVGALVTAPGGATAVGGATLGCVIGGLGGAVAGGLGGAVISCDGCTDPEKVSEEEVVKIEDLTKEEQRWVVPEEISSITLE